MQNWSTAQISTSDGAEINVRLTGNGPVLFFLHGWSMSSSFWQHQEPLAARYTLVCPDLRAHGNSSDTNRGHSIPRYAEDMCDVLNQLEIPEILLTGWSMGGPLALALWQMLGPKRIKAMALVEMTTFPFSDASWNTHGLREHNKRGLASVLNTITKDREAHLRRFVRTMFKSRKIEKDVLAWMFDEANLTPASAAAAIYKDYVQRDYDAVLSTVGVPAVAAYGDSGQMCFGPLTGVHMAESLPQGELAVFRQSGHMPFWEEPAAFNRALDKLAVRAGMR